MGTIFASTHGGKVRIDGDDIRTDRLQTAINRSSPGDVIELLPGRYTQPVVVSEGGTCCGPVTIRGRSDFSAILDGQQDRDSAVDDFEPMDDDFAFTKLQSVDWITLEWLAFENCWPSAMFVRGCRDITIQNCRIIGGRFGVYARNRRGHNETCRIVLDGITWVQDPDHDMWEGRTTWHDVKQQGKRTDKDARYFNGGLFGSYNIPGPVSIRNCDISHAFNAIRMDADRNEPGRNKNFLIERNRFSYIRDNAVEPESVAEGLWVLENWFFNIHAAFSLDGVDGRYWYFINNRLLNVAKPGTDEQENRGGKIFKFDPEPPFPQKAFYALYNSVQTRTTYAKGQTRDWHHSNNAIGICRSGLDCSADKEMLGDKFTWHGSYNFHQDICDHPDFPDAMSRKGYKVHGCNSQPATFATPTFTNTPHLHVEGWAGAGWDGELTLSAGSPGFGSSSDLTIELPDGSTKTIEGGRDIGAQPLGSIRLPVVEVI